MRCPSILGCDPKEARRRWRRALIREYMMMAVTPVRDALPEVTDGILAALTSALGFVALASIAVMMAM